MTKLSQYEADRIRAEFNVWWQQHFQTNENFQHLTNKMQDDFKKVAWETWKAAKQSNSDNK